MEAPAVGFRDKSLRIAYAVLIIAVISISANSVKRFFIAPI